MDETKQYNLNMQLLKICEGDDEVEYGYKRVDDDCVYDECVENCKTKYEKIEKLIQMNANVDIGNEYKLTPLHMMSANDSDFEIVKLLLENKADVHAKDDVGATPLHISCDEGGELNVSKLLLKHGANPSVQDKHGYTPLHFACCSFDVSLDLIKTLLEYKADTSLKEENGTTPLIIFNKLTESEDDEDILKVRQLLENK